MAGSDRIVLVIGSAPDALRARSWPRGSITDIVAINNAWRVRTDWDWHIHPDDLPEDRRPPTLREGQVRVTAADYVPLQNALGGFVYAGGTMAFTAGYWALEALAPQVIAWLGCDMVYAARGDTHFYGKGAPDPLRPDVTLRSLEAKSARLMLLAAARGTACVNLSKSRSRLVFPRAAPGALGHALPVVPAPRLIEAALAEERRLDYSVPSGRYWDEEARFDSGAIDRLDSLWLAAWHDATRSAGASRRPAAG